MKKPEKKLENNLKKKSTRTFSKNINHKQPDLWREDLKWLTRSGVSVAKEQSQKLISFEGKCRLDITDKYCPFCGFFLNGGIYKLVVGDDVSL